MPPTSVVKRPRAYYALSPAADYSVARVVFEIEGVHVPFESSLAPMSPYQGAVLRGSVARFRLARGSRLVKTTALRYDQHPMP